MKTTTSIKTLAFTIITGTLFVACGGSSNSNSNGYGNDNGYSGSGSNIPYLRTNHANYSEHGSNSTPAPTKDANAKSINWTISATTVEGATKLAEHLAFMEAKLQADQNPRAFDKLFLMEAYMKFNNYYSTNVEQSSTNVIVSKNANTSCAYDVISAHSDAVSGDFFAQGDINNDYSAIAEGILASASCNAERASIEMYISQRQQTRGNNN